ncbi:MULTISPECIES: single-stranded-DNA-specific exonuclease RecJ [Gammaproteobacteria]|uniref:single-stranded-DNA-specific exonuclease RecJ n=1 Tax=Gammaproteobacteria TaxID=1236 RepID=UPI000DD06B2A|nr:MULTISPECIES: single-stranded-DNA-specific exonuclease RecJ [Gammaproteobacteria]RTE87013.1 single-stranded-DNA-specific exonuclease RecJ [Aliidiomarina sp. B3213]TCZ93197.1 single-stranded-DNA-specific exonuclease RecJ [Lysobacter sp. N42]
MSDAVEMTLRRRQERDFSSLPESLPLTLRKVLARRGVSHISELEYGLKGLLHFNTLRDCEKAAQIIGEAILAQEKICIVGDFDADGATSVSLFVLALTAMGAQDVSFLVPNRFTDGYGLTAPLSEIAHQQNCRCLITVDNGISAIEGVARAKELGLRVVVTDHHLPGSQMPDADAIVNPNHPECSFASKAIAGVGVTFYVLMALRTWFRENHESHVGATVNLAQWLDLVAVGTVSDVVPLDYNNRILVQQGVARIRGGQCQPGVSTLLEAAGRDPSKLVAQDLGFTVGPRINAAGRLDDMNLGINCLLAGDYEQAKASAFRLDTLNRERRTIEQDMREQAESSVAQVSMSGNLPAIIVLYHENWHQGVIGIVAGRIKEKYHRPVIAFAKDENNQLRGSARSIPGLHIRDVLERVHTLDPNIIVKFGGHAMAAGLTLDASKLDAFQQSVEQVVEQWADEDMLTPVVWSDGELQPEEISLDFIHQLENVGPWGQKFEAPVFDNQFEVKRHAWLKEKHLKLWLKDPRSGQEVEAIAFFAADAKWSFEPCQKVTLAYRLQANEFRGVVTPQLVVEYLWCNPS